MALVPPICTVTGTLIKADGKPMIDTHIYAIIQSTDVDQGGQIAGGKGITSDPIEAFTDIWGAFSIDLLQGTKVLFSIPSINLRKEVLVPALNTVDFVSLI